MLYDFLLLSRTDSRPLCLQLYAGLRHGIESGKLLPGEKLASIRDASAELCISRTTVESAYARLCMEGFAESRPQSGYRVRAAAPPADPVFPAVFRPEYDFTTSSIEPAAADLANWRRLMRAVLADEDTVTAYGDAQGEPELRRALSAYAFRARGVSAEAENIFIGAGTGPLLQLLCPVLPQHPSVVMECPGFVQAEQIFRDYAFPVSIAGGPAELPAEKNAVMAILPSLRPHKSAADHSARRAALAAWAGASPGRWVLEDDYNGELNYRTHPAPAFQGFCPEKTIYLGSFSKLLIPSVRIAYMVLPAPLAKQARSRLPMLNQTAGKTEQMALAEYIRTGLLEKHLRRLRRLYSRKCQLIAEALQRVFGARCPFTLHENSLSFTLQPDTEASGEALCRAAHRAGIACRTAPDSGDGARILLGFSGISAAQIAPGIAALGDAWRPFLAP